MRSFFINLILLLATALAGGFTIEYGVRVILPQYDPSGHVGFTTNQDGVVLAKNLGKLRQIKNTGDYDVEIRINDLGLRETKSFNSAKAIDIFVVGDSFSFGWGVEENDRFSNILDTLLPKRKIFNVSIPTDFDGYEKLLIYAKKHGAKIKRLIVGVAIENDLRIYSQIPTQRVGIAPKIEPVLPVQLNQFIQPLKYYLRDHSAAYFFITTQIHRIPVLQNFLTRFGLIIPNTERILNANIKSGTIKSSADRLSNLVKNYDAHILIIPSRSLWIGSTDQKNIAKQIHDGFVAAISRYNLNYTDMRIPMERSKNPLQYHFKNDGHWNKFGHQLAAEELRKILTPLPN